MVGRAGLDRRHRGYGRKRVFIQERVGRDGRRFRVIKLRTMRVGPGVTGCGGADKRRAPSQSPSRAARAGS
ncbi:MAG: sugar transferase [Spiribacter salinus]|uniref:Sugar transferase n=1 Tax=Spiribacter salinus TaxID=1335746 RepID=A0A540VVL4_9GAMM|nr:MAG: sugar transferase [Spiribacter salinus]